LGIQNITLPDAVSRRAVAPPERAVEAVPHRLPTFIGAHNPPDALMKSGVFEALVPSLPEPPRIVLPDIHDIRRDLDARLLRSSGNDVCREREIPRLTPPVQSFNVRSALTRIGQAKTLEQALPSINVLLRAGGYPSKVLPAASPSDRSAADPAHANGHIQLGTNV